MHFANSRLHLFSWGGGGGGESISVLEMHAFERARHFKLAKKNTVESLFFYLFFCASKRKARESHQKSYLPSSSPLLLLPPLLTACHINLLLLSKGGESKEDKSSKDFRSCPRSEVLFFPSNSVRNSESRFLEWENDVLVFFPHRRLPLLLLPA